MHNLLVDDQLGEFDWAVRVRNADLQNEIVLDATGGIHNEIHVARLDRLPGNEHADAPLQLVPLCVLESAARPMPRPETRKHMKRDASEGRLYEARVHS